MSEKTKLKTIIDQINETMSDAELRAVFSDGQLHELTLLNAVFLDGKSLPGEAYQPFIVTSQCNGYEDFNEKFTYAQEAFAESLNISYLEMAAMREATSLAGMIVCYLMVSGLGNDPDYKVALSDSLSVVGWALGVSCKNGIDVLDYSMLAHPDLNTRCLRFIEKYEGFQFERERFGVISGSEFSEGAEEK